MVSDDVEMGNGEEEEVISRGVEVWAGVSLYVISIHSIFMVLFFGVFLNSS